MKNHARSVLTAVRSRRLELPLSPPQSPGTCGPAPTPTGARRAPAIRILQFLLLATLTTPGFAQEAVPIVARPISENWGDEYVAAGSHREAFDQYRAMWSQWQIISRLEVKKGATVTPETAQNLDRLARKMAKSLEQLDPPPAIPENAVHAAQKGAAYVKLAKGPDDFAAAAEQFEIALYLAPWVSEYHYNLAVCERAIGRPALALNAIHHAALLTKDEKSLHDITALKAELEVLVEMKNRK